MVILQVFRRQVGNMIFLGIHMHTSYVQRLLEIIETIRIFPYLSEEFW